MLKVKLIYFCSFKVKTQTVTRHIFRTFFLGSEIVIAGQLDGPTTKSVSGSLDARGAEGKMISEKLPKPISMDCIEWPYPIVVRETAEPGIAERVWAYLTIQQLLDEDKAGNSESKKKALELALKVENYYHSKRKCKNHLMCLCIIIFSIPSLLLSHLWSW